MITLYFDETELIDGKRIFITNDHDIIMKNLSAVSRDLYLKCSDNIANEGSFFTAFPLGKNVCLASLTLDTLRSEMTLVNAELTLIELSAYITAHKAGADHSIGLIMKAYDQALCGDYKFPEFEIKVKEAGVLDSNF